MELTSSALNSVLVLSLGLLLLVIRPVTAATPTLLTDLALVEALRNGGYNIYFRHVSTDWSQSDGLHQVDDWLSCDPAQMRQLSEPGRADAVAIGDAIRTLEIPVGEILASPYCRTVETARLMKLGEVTTSTAVMNLRAAEYFGGRAAIVATARALLATSPRPGTNRVIVAHGNVASAATPAYPAEGEGLVFKPEDDGSFILVGRVEPGQWAELLATVAD
ncbi:MAG: histidine phosphatase family protein [Gammaproteobacteria bacterium]|nr:histidine phosphatase family protein [Gammaproteobacteria bacterium]